MQDKEYAGFWVRFGATLIDVVVLLIVCTIPTAIIYGEKYWLGSSYIKGFWDIVINYVLPFIATIFFWQKYLGTPGKMATNLQVLDAETGEKLSVQKSIIRYFAYLVSLLPFCLGFIWVGIDKKKQGFHDKIAGSVVIRNKASQPVRFGNGV